MERRTCTKLKLVMNQRLRWVQLCSLPMKRINEAKSFFSSNSSCLGLSRSCEINRRVRLDVDTFRLILRRIHLRDSNVIVISIHFREFIPQWHQRFTRLTPRRVKKQHHVFVRLRDDFVEVRPTTTVASFALGAFFGGFSISKSAPISLSRTSDELD